MARQFLPQGGYRPPRIFEPGVSLWHKKRVSGSWLQLFLKAPPSALDAISNFLIERGSPGVVIKRDGIQAFFGLPAKPSSLKREIQRFLLGVRAIYPELGKPELRWTVLKDRNWNLSWRRFFSPQKVGRSFWIGPPWAPPPTASGRKVITIEPGMAFGTGTHPTTRCCLEFLEEVTTSLRRKKVAALDIGTGSGILAIALAKLGVREVWALDNDPVALKAARINVRRNRVAGAVRLCSVSLDRVERSFTIVVANLTAETIIDLRGALKKKVSPRGYLILSGILDSKAREVLRRLDPAPFGLVGRRTQKEWTTLLLRKKG